MAQARPILGYWNIRAFDRGNVNRYIMAYAGVDYEEKRYDFDNNKAEWSEGDKMSLGLDYPNLPYIIDGDFNLTESAAVTMYICDKWAPALMGSNHAERARVIQLQCVLKDAFLGFLMPAFQGKGQEVVKGLAMEKIAKPAEYLADKNFLTGDNVCMADFILYEFVETVLAMHHDRSLFVTHPNLEPFHARIKALPNMAAYFASDKFLAMPFFIPAANLDMQMPQ